ncbi:MAG: aldolase [Oscillospiraceae bacterium]|nr:aldolase [Oscillospiraceae bacterium]MBR3474602.1 aldolase [Oscillospiraceae bacterium]
MPLKLMYITNRPDIALIAEKNGVDRIFVDMEYIGKAERQGNLDTVKNHHTIHDIQVLRGVLTQSELLVRVNPIHEKTDEYDSSEDEIEATVQAGADVIMLPFFKTVAEVKRFLRIVNGRARTMLLLETPEAVEVLDEILDIPGIDEIHIGINDLSLGYKKRFMFELLTDGTVERLCRQIGQKGIFYGFGGIASLGRGLVPAELIIKEHYWLGSRMAILSRSFCNVDQFEDINAIEEIFFRGVREIRTLEKECASHTRYFTDNRKELKAAVEAVVSGKTRKEK